MNIDDLNIDVETTIDTAKSLLLEHGLNILFAVIILLVGFKLTKILTQHFEKFLVKKDIEKSLTLFLSNLLGWVFKVALIISCIKTIGFETTSFVAILGSAGLAIGLALQGSLANLAGGVLILLLKPFKVGDFIKAQGFAGTVEKITTFYTELRTPDNQIIFVPNGGLANTSITNVNMRSERRVDFIFGISYDDDFERARQIIASFFKSDERVLKEPEFQIYLGEMADSSINIFARAWVKTENYWPFYWYTMESIKKIFDQENITIPYPQRDVHLHEKK